MGTIIFCYDHEKNRHVVLKGVKNNPTAHKDTVLGFFRETSHWIRIGKHPFIVQPLGLELFGDPCSPHLVLEHIGNSKHSACVGDIIMNRKGHPFGFRKTIKIAWQISQAMSYASTKISGFVHHDIKLGNILIDDQNNARLTDFGMARTSKDDYLSVDSIKKTPLYPAGTAPYIAPEKWLFEKVLDHRVDIYALGITMFEMITSTRCAIGKNTAELRKSHLEKSLRTIPEQVPKHISSIISRCTMFDKKNRYQSWSSLIEDLEKSYSKMTGEILSVPVYNKTEDYLLQRKEKEMFAIFLSLKSKNNSALLDSI